MKTSILRILSICFIGLISFLSCKDKEQFDNQLFISSPKSEILLNKGSNTTEDRVLITSIAQPEKMQIDIQYAVASNLIERYNLVNGTKAIMVPEANYSFSSKSASISIGAVASTPVTISFKDINKLDRDLLYVLPVVVQSSNLGILESSKTTYYVIKGGALINVVANLEKNYLHIANWTKPDVVNNLKKFTLEALIRAHDYDRLISTVMGIEGLFLIRIGDAGFPPNQIQVSTSAGNFPSADPSKGLPVNKWIHIAVTYNDETQDIKIYVDGKVQSVGKMRLNTLDLGYPNRFYIGRSYEDARYLNGEFSECRIWNIERTATEIANNPYEVAPKSTGLVAYWKCNEGAGNDIMDHTGNGNNLTSKAATPIKWVPVNLPEKK